MPQMEFLRPSTHNKVWHGYAPYNPAMMEKYLTIFRTVDNFVFKGDDGKTPAMRLGFAKAPLEYEDILWGANSNSTRNRCRIVFRVPQGRAPLSDLG